ncbi:ADP-ribosylation factor-like protein 6-interacting protein 6 [Brachyistius frenatus]|uniref:ADP-ribosylation factor-like protein 6-interacting protein 6 n=1 Tax=Brachyistius frenatus TaxID=100188 RepID=UPI0037E9BB7D
MMPSNAAGGDVFRESFGRSTLSEVRQHPRPPTGESPGGSARQRPAADRDGPAPRPAVLLSVLGSAAAVAAAGCLCALVYPILKELRAERLTGDDGTDRRMLGFWSILVMSLLAGCVCCVFSWSLTYLDLYRASEVSPGLLTPPPALLTPPPARDVSGDGLHLSYRVAALNGVMAMITVIWNLS